MGRQDSSFWRVRHWGLVRPSDKVEVLVKLTADQCLFCKCVSCHNTEAYKQRRYYLFVSHFLEHAEFEGLEVAGNADSVHL